MKKKLLSLGLGLAVVFASVCADASTVRHVTIRMLTGTYLCVSNSQTITPATATNIWMYSYAAGTNVLCGTTNSAGTLYPAGLVQAPIFADLNADITPNAALQIVLGYTNITFVQGVQTPVMLNTVWTNPSPVFVPSPLATNLYTITLTVVSSGDFNVPDTAASYKTWSFTGEMTNGIVQVVSTNLPQNFLQGAYAVYPTVTIGAGTNSNNGVIINGLNLTGWAP